MDILVLSAVGGCLGGVFWAILRLLSADEPEAHEPAPEAEAQAEPAPEPALPFDEVEIAASAALPFDVVPVGVIPPTM